MPAHIPAGKLCHFMLKFETPVEKATMGIYMENQQNHDFRPHLYPSTLFLKTPHKKYSSKLKTLTLPLTRKPLCSRSHLQEPSRHYLRRTELNSFLKARGRHCAKSCSYICLPKKGVEDISPSRHFQFNHRILNLLPR